MIPLSCLELFHHGFKEAEVGPRIKLPFLENGWMSKLDWLKVVPIDLCDPN
jgi:hypothetical protein